MPGEPDLEVMRPTKDAIPPRPRRVVPVPRPGSDGGSDGDDGEGGGDGGEGDDGDE